MSHRLLATMPGCKIRIGCTFVEEVDENSCCPHDYDMSISKAKAVQGATQKATTRKRLRRTRPSVAYVNDPYFLELRFNFLTLFFRSNQTLRLKLSSVRSCCLRRLIQHQSNLHRLILKRSQFWWKYPMLPQRQKM